MENPISKTKLEKIVTSLNLFMVVSGAYIVFNMVKILCLNLSELSLSPVDMLLLMIPVFMKLIVILFNLVILVLVSSLSVIYIKKVIDSYKCQNYKNITFKIFYILLVGFLSIVVDLITVNYSSATFLFVGIINIFLMIVLKNRFISKKNI